MILLYSPVLGSHLSVAGGMVNALREATRLKMDCVQVFTANQRQWNPKAPDAQQRAEWLETLRAMNWDFTIDNAATTSSPPARVVSHNSYLINLASPDAILRKRSIAAMRAEIERCEDLHIPLVVMHPGAHLGKPRHPGDPNNLNGDLSNDERTGLKRIVRALDQIQRDLAGYRTIACLETTVGSGTNLGYAFEHLAFIRENSLQPERIGYCFDTCHVTAAGYGMCSPADAKAVLERWDDVCGLANIRAFHFNDSVGAVGSRKDRHAHIGEGCCTRHCFHILMNWPGFAFVPKVLETPKDDDPRGRAWDRVNMLRLRRMVTAQSNGTSNARKNRTARADNAGSPKRRRPALA